MKVDYKKISVLQGILACAITAMAGNLHAMDMTTPSIAVDAAGHSTGLPAPSHEIFSSPMTSSAVGKTFLRAEADPPVVTRGAGSTSLERLFAARCRSVVLIANYKSKDGKLRLNGTGTGSIVTMHGHILTAEHVINGADAVFAGVFPSCKPGARPELFATRVVRADRSRDLAVVKLVKLPTDISIMPLGKLENVRTGSSVVMIGHPRGLFMSLSQGAVSAIRPNYRFLRDRQATVIQTDGMINPGNSGGPMLSSDGYLIGVNSFSRRDGTGLNFAVSVTDIRQFLSGKNSASTSGSTATPPRAQHASARSSCKPKRLKKWRKNNALYVSYDMDCSGRTSGILIMSEQPGKIPMLFIDRNHDNKPDAVIMFGKDNKPYTSRWDDDYDGTYDYRGEHANGSWVPYRKVRL